MAKLGRLRGLGRGLELSGLIESYLLCCRAEGKSPNTIRWYEQKLSAIVDYLRARHLPLDPEGLTPEIVRGLVTHLQASGVSAFTTRGYVQVLKGLFTWLEGEDYISHNPLHRVKLPKTPKYVVRPLEDDEVHRMLLHLDHRSPAGSRDLTIFLLLLDTGMRLGELARLTVADADQAIRDGMMKVFGKGARERVVPVGTTVQYALRRYVQAQRPDTPHEALFVARDGRPLTAEGLRQVIRRLADRAAVKGVHPHRLRHTAAITFLRAGGDVFALQRILGHSSLEVTRNYVVLTANDVKAAHRKASPADRFSRYDRSGSGRSRPSGQSRH